MLEKVPKHVHDSRKPRPIARTENGICIYPKLHPRCPASTKNSRNITPITQKKTVNYPNYT